jgi:hypothetical protein
LDRISPKNKVRVTVRPMKPVVAGDAFGDAPVMTSHLRDTTVTGVVMQVTMTSGTVKPGQPGRDRDVRALAILRRKDVPRDQSWTPSINDVIELPDGEKLFIVDVQNAFPKRRSLGRPNGGFGGWRLVLSDLTPTVNPATSYEL